MKNHQVSKLSISINFNAHTDEICIKADQKLNTLTLTTKTINASKCVVAVSI